MARVGVMTEFQFYTKLDQTIMLGTKARDVAELLEGIRTVPKSSIYHHTHRFLQQHHYLSPEPPNDFAYWITEVLNDALLGELLSSIDIVQFHSIADLRKCLTDVVSSYLGKSGNRNRCAPGEEFYFMASRTFALRTEHVARSLSEFADVLQRVSISSLYYHMFDAKLRLEQNENDFSKWFKELGNQKLSDEVKLLDPYTHTLEGLRRRLLVMVRQYDRH